MREEWPLFFLPKHPIVGCCRHGYEKRSCCSSNLAHISANTNGQKPNPPVRGGVHAVQLHASHYVVTSFIAWHCKTMGFSSITHFAITLPSFCMLSLFSLSRESDGKVKKWYTYLFTYGWWVEWWHYRYVTWNLFEQNVCSFSRLNHPTFEKVSLVFIKCRMSILHSVTQC